jgi:hypothetical protein
MMRFLLLVFAFFFMSPLSAQEHEGALRRNSVPLTQKKKGGHRKDLLTLPFFDDFAQHRAVGDYPNSMLWQDSSAYINNHFATAPLTLGVATLDGLNAWGEPYDFTDQYAQGPADTLTSQPIQLAGLDSTDQVFLMFHYQAGGWGNMPDEEDSLYVDFYSPLTNNWKKVWSVSSDNTTDFKQQFLSIKTDNYLMTGFQFRFRNDATLSGSFDQWNIDYVVLDQGIDTANYIFDEVAMQYVPSNLLKNGFTSMPWTHFKEAPLSYLADSLFAYERNLGATQNIATRYSIRAEGQFFQVPTPFVDPSGNANQELVVPFEYNGNVLDNALLNDSMVVADICTYINPTDAHLENDTSCYQLTLSNYYAYDDGTAERSWTVQAPGAKVALKFNSVKADTLLGLGIYWIPYGVDHQNQTFFLRAWAEGGGEPGAVLSESFNYQYPDYHDTIAHQFSYYAYDEPIALNSGSFYVGWVQSDPQTYDVGNDKNTNQNPAHLFYALGSDQPWTASSVQGSVMVRPVFKSGLAQPWIGVANNKESSDVYIYPNPVHDQLNVKASSIIQDFDVIDMQGRGMMTGKLGAFTSSISTNHLPSGMYMLRLYTTQGVVVKRFIKS